MMILLTGGSKSGKSALAERMLDDFSGSKIYIATMQPYGAEADIIIERHHAMRQGKGFSTLEIRQELFRAEIPPGSAVLLEDIPNLCANEMFTESGIQDPVSPVLRGIRHLQASAAMTVLVTAETGADGRDYPEETKQYQRDLAKINRETAALADTVIECAAGLPIILKGALPCDL